MKRYKPAKTPVVPFSKDLGLYFKAKREEAGFTQAEVSQFLGHRTAMLVSKFERGVAAIKFTDLVKVVKLYKLKESEVMQVLMDEQEKLFSFYMKSRQAN